jgi:RNA polymerase sigma-70 factor (ECF subfamily)
MTCTGARQVGNARVIRLSAPDAALAEEAQTAASIVARIRQDSEEAKTELFERYGPGLLKHALRQVKDRARAEGIVQETFSIALAKLADDDLEYPERLAGYLMGIARHRILAHYRNLKKEPVVSEPELVEAIEDVRPLQFDNIAREQTGAVIRKLLDSLPVERDREILLRVYLYEQDRAEVRAALKLSPHQLDVALSRARSRFKKLLLQSDFARDVLPGRLRQ